MFQILRIHDSTKSHRDAVAADIATNRPEEAPLAVVVRGMSETLLERMMKLFNIAYYVAKCELPFAQFPHWVACQIKNGVTLGDNYMSDNACRW